MLIPGMRPWIIITALIVAACSESREDPRPSQASEPEQEPLPPLPPEDKGAPATDTPAPRGEQSPFVTGGSGRRVPPGHSTELTLDGQATTIPYTQIGALGSRRKTVSFLLTAEPSLDAERIGPNRFPSLSIAWDVPATDITRLDDLAGRTFELDEVGLGRIVIRLGGKEYMATRFKLAFDEEAQGRAIAGRFSGIVGEFEPRLGMKPTGELELTGTFRAFPGGWAGLQGGD
jgi:hypothetical protein